MSIDVPTSLSNKGEKMKFFKSLVFVALTIAAVGCGTLGEVRISGDPVTVEIGDEILEHSEKVEELRDHHAVERLLAFVTAQLKKLHIRDTLKLTITINKFRVGWGRDFMAVIVYVEENGKEIKTFTSIETTSRDSQVYRLTKGLARRIGAEMQLIM